MTAATGRTSLGLGSLSIKDAVGSSDITDGTITDTDISGSAAITGSKISGWNASNWNSAYTESITNATSANTASTLIKRDSYGNINVSTVNALNLNISNNINVSGKINGSLFGGYIGGGVFVTGTDYTADSDGFVICYMEQTADGDKATLVAYIGATTANLIILKDSIHRWDASNTVVTSAGFCFPVQKGIHWKVDKSIVTGNPSVTIVVMKIGQ